MVRVTQLLSVPLPALLDPAMPRLLPIHELGAKLSDELITGSVQHVSASTLGKRLPRDLALALSLGKLSRTSDVLLVDQGVGLRLAALRRAGLAVPPFAAICYDPFPCLTPQTSSPLPGVERSIRRWLYRRFDLMLVVSSSQAAWLRTVFAGHPPVASYPMSIDHATFRRTRQGTGDHILVVDGAVRDYRTLSLALSLCGHRPARLVLTHRAPLPLAARSCLAEIEGIGIAVEIRTNVDAATLRRLYEDCRAVVVPILPTAQPAGLTALLEAMAMECPIVVTGGAWTVEYAQQERDVLVVAPGDARGMAQAIDRLMREDELCSALALSARNRVEALTFERSRAAIRAALMDVVAADERAKVRADRAE